MNYSVPCKGHSRSRVEVDVVDGRMVNSNVVADNFGNRDCCRSSMAVTLFKE